jgi:hypothetical protein
MRFVRYGCAIIASATLWASPAAASVILSPVAITSNTMGTFCGSCFYDQNDMINQHGLLTPFVSGVTDFDSYMALDPQHTTSDGGYEWFSPEGVMSGSLTFDLGALYAVDRVAAWADEFAGFGTTNVYTSLDGIIFSLVGTFTPTNHPSLPDGGANHYGADVASLLVTQARYVRFDILGPQTPRLYDGLGIGEVAFSVTSPDAAPVPEPESLVLIATGLGLLGVTLVGRHHFTQLSHRP